MTASFHKFGDYFPGTGDARDIGYGKGKYYSLNVPLDDGIDDESYQSLFKPIMAKVMEVFQPGAVVLQCGADSLSGDRLGCFNLSVKGHAECVRYMRSFNVPLLLVGGGGYTIRNVARCWCYETAVAVGEELDDKLPHHEYYEYFGPDYTLHVAPSNMANQNSKKDLDNLRLRLLENLSKLQHVPSVQFSERPPDTELHENEDEDLELRDKGRTWDGELSDSDSEEHDLRRRNQGVIASEAAFARRPPPLGLARGKSEEETGEAMSSEDEIEDMEDDVGKVVEDTKSAPEEQVEMDVDQAVLAEPEDELPTKMEIGEVPRTEEADTSAAPTPAAVVTPPTTTSNAARENALQTATAPVLSLHPSSSTPSAPSKPVLNLHSFGRTVDRTTPAPAAPNSTQSTLFVSPPSSTGFPQRSQAPAPPVTGLNASGRQSQPGNHSKSNNQVTGPPSQAPAGSSVGNRASPSVNLSAGSASVFSVGSGSGILPRPGVGPIPPPARSGSGPPGPASNSARPAGPVSNRFPPTPSPVVNPGEPAPPGQGGHIDIPNRKVVLQGVPQTP
ncbi:hypothetical protein M758_7G153800 [Ceratodon purpureus]|nr:hypothetical protein M758_7G153800 [Ceratodon purpureus]